MRGTIGAEDEGHVADAFAMRHCLRVQRDMDNRFIVMVLQKLQVNIIKIGERRGRRT
jgi:hypothetical protein